MAGRDDALSWGDDDPTLDTGRPSIDDDAVATTAVPVEPSGVGTPDARTDATADPGDPGTTARTGDDDAPAAGTGNVGLIAYGVLGGVYLLLAIGWLIGGLRLQGVAAFLVSADGTAPPTWSGGNLVGVVLAALSPVIWFGTVWLLTRGGRGWVRWLLLIAGVVLLLPWPFIMVGVVGS